jgi:DNA ligase-1
MLTLNTGRSVFKAISAIAATASKLEKDALLKAAGSSSTLFLKAVTYAYDPFRNYGISNAPGKTPGSAPGGNTLEEPLAWKVLDDLASRSLSGNSARDTVQNMVNLLDEPSAEVFRRIINKDMRAGFSEGTINRAFKGTIAEFPYMRCSLPAKSNMPKWDWSVGIIVQEKADGMFANVNLDAKGFLWITSRAGSPFPAGCLGLEDDMRRTLTPGTQTHGEFTVFENGELLARAESNGVMNSLLSGGALEANQRVVFEAWDQIPLTAVVPKGKYLTPYKTRFVALARQCLAAQRAGITSVRSIPTRIVKTKSEAYAYYRELLKKRKEGVVCKHPDAVWADNTSKDQVKLKLTFEVELRVVGIIPGKPGSKTEATIGALQCRSECQQLETGVGTGLTDALRQAIRDNPELWLNSIITVKANDIANPDDEGDDLHSLFLPVYVERRPEKRSADTLTQIRDQREAAMDAA